MRLFAALITALLAFVAPATAQIPLGPSMLAFGTQACTGVTAVTLNPADKSTDITLSGSNLIMSSNAANTGADGIARATVSFSSGNEYYEARQTAGNNGHFAVGWSNSTQALGTFIGSSANSFGQEATAPGQMIENNVFTNIFATPPALNTWIGIAYNINLGLVWVTDDGINFNTGLAGTQNPATGQGGFSITGLAAGPYFPAASAGGDTVQVTGQFNFGGSAFAYSVPSTFNPVQAACGAPAANAYSLTGPTSGTVGSITGNFTVQSNGSLTSAVTITPNDSGNGGSFTPASCSLSTGNGTSCTFQYTPAVAATFNIATTNSSTLIDPNPISFTATSGGGTTGFFVAKNGSDANPGTQASPFLTIQAGINAACASPTNKTVIVRSSATVYSMTQTNITCAGITITNFASDGVCKAILDGGSTADGTGAFEIFEVQAANVKINGLMFQNFQQAAVKSVGPNHGGVANANTQALNNCVTRAFSNGTNGGPFTTWGATGFTVKNNVCWNIESHCVSAFITQLGDDWSGFDVENNIIWKADTSNPDMGPIYMWDGVDVVSRTCTIKNNYLNNYGSEANTNKGLYLDDRVSGCNLSYNIVTGTGANAVFIHGGINNVFTCNILDVNNFGNQFSVGGYQDDGSSNMAGNAFKFNLIMDYGAAFTQPAWFNSITASETQLASDRNIYWNNDGGPLAVGGITDTNQITGTNPGFTDTTWNYTLPSTSIFYSGGNCTPGNIGNWGPPSLAVNSNTVTLNGATLFTGLGSSPSYLN